MAEWLESLTSNHLPLTAVGSIPGLTGSQKLSCEEAIQLAYGRSVVLPKCPPGTWGLPLPSKLEQSPYDLSLCRCDFKPKSKTLFREDNSYKMKLTKLM